jgi:hypothetical protein
MTEHPVIAALRELATSPCVRSGMCCKTSACAFGDWDAAAHQCRFLQTTEQGDGYTVYACGIKDKIDALPPDAGAQWNPAFGAGCCMPLFNRNREAIIAAHPERIKR